MEPKRVVVILNEANGNVWQDDMFLVFQTRGLLWVILFEKFTLYFAQAKKTDLQKEYDLEIAAAKAKSSAVEVLADIKAVRAKDEYKSHYYKWDSAKVEKEVDWDEDDQ